MNLVNWTTRFRVGNTRNSEEQPDGQGSESDSADAPSRVGQVRSAFARVGADKLAEASFLVQFK